MRQRHLHLKSKYKAENSLHGPAQQWTRTHSIYNWGSANRAVYRVMLRWEHLSSCVNILVLVPRKHSDEYWWENLPYKEWNLTASHCWYHQEGLQFTAYENPCPHHTADERPTGTGKGSGQHALETFFFSNNKWPVSRKAKLHNP